ncbi:hypothetical protein APA_310 [Pseudanabaena sp. lw0831]|nr:hypothetical protein APA_310 [Pseudanabaena sp. lw0831]
MGGEGRSLFDWEIGDRVLGGEGRSLFDLRNRRSGLRVVRGDLCLTNLNPMQK